MENINPIYNEMVLVYILLAAFVSSALKKPIHVSAERPCIRCVSGIVCPPAFIPAFNE
jgi:hypothetical protein